MPEFRGNRVTDKTLRDLKDLSDISHLHLLDTSVTVEGIAILANAVNLREIFISSDLLTDRCMEVLCKLPLLQSLLLDGVPFVTDAGIAHLEQRKKLRELYLKGTHLTDRGINYFTHIEGLWSVDLSCTLVTDRGVSELAQLEEVSLLNLRETVVVGEGLCALPVDNRLDVYLDRCPVTDAAVVAFSRRLTNLTALSLLGTLVTDRCLPNLAKLPNIEMLRLTETNITDSGILSLVGHPSLVTLEIGGTAVSVEAEEQLKASSPNELIVCR